MRPMNAVLVAVLGLVPAVASAQPLVWLHVPDVVTQRVESADVALTAEREQVESARHAIVATRGDREHLKSRRRDAVADRIEARRDVADARRDLRRALRSGDDGATTLRAARTVDALETLEDARAHVKWHDATLRLNRAELSVDRARRAHAAAELEFGQAVLMHGHGWRFVPGPAAFERQVGRVERAIEAREARVEVARGVAADRRADFVAVND